MLVLPFEAAYVPEENEVEVVRTRKEMNHREQIVVEEQILRSWLENEEMDRWWLRTS